MSSEECSERLKRPYRWTKPRKPFSVRARKEDCRLVKRLSVKLGVSQNQVFLEALRHYHSHVFNKPSEP